MRPQSLLGGLAAVVLLSGMTTGARAQDVLREQIRAQNFACNRGDRAACVRMGILIGEHHEREVDWRREHPNWGWWAR
jgi:hypothetical protein